MSYNNTRGWICLETCSSNSMVGGSSSIRHNVARLDGHANTGPMTQPPAILGEQGLRTNTQQRFLFRILTGQLPLSEIYIRRAEASAHPQEDAREDSGRHLPSQIQSTAGQLASCLPAPNEETMAVRPPDPVAITELIDVQRATRIGVQEHSC